MDKRIPIQAFSYDLPNDRIAQTAAEPRDSSKLLVYDSGRISDGVFSNLAEFLPRGSHLYFNNARVIPARLFLHNRNGARIEVLLLQPHGSDYIQALESDGICCWQCLVGNSKKWKQGEELQLAVGRTLLKLNRGPADTVEFTWDGGRHFADLLEEAGQMPLPPYIRHSADAYDRERYQTVYASVRGSVAAPTAGLHFTGSVMDKLHNAGITQDYVTLHVGAGTFMPVKTEDAREHPMHRELFTVNTALIKSLLVPGPKIAVGTTSCRVLESLYWFAVNILEERGKPHEIAQFDYENRRLHPEPEAAFKVLLDYAAARGSDVLSGETSVMIAPPYSMRVCDGLITNFHQPGSTLLLLIASLLGDDWRAVYAHALEGDYRFLSYGDSSLLLPKRIF